MTKLRSKRVLCATITWTPRSASTTSASGIHLPISMSDVMCVSHSISIGKSSRPTPISYDKDPEAYDGH